MKLSEAGPEIDAAVERMLQRPREHRPFVIVEDSVTGKFAQFCDCPRTGALLFDCPALSIEAVEVDRSTKPSESALWRRLRDLPELPGATADDGCPVRGDRARAHDAGEGRRHAPEDRLRSHAEEGAMLVSEMTLGDLMITAWPLLLVTFVLGFNAGLSYKASTKEQERK